MTFHNRYGITLAADLYIPKNVEGKLAAIAVCGPFGAVKEQASGLYAQTMAERGFLTMAFDPSFTGESGGKPRYMDKQRELSYVRQATIDALTGCKNRRAFDSDIAALMNDHQPFALALVDIDNFKSINDTWGHLNGDIVLRNVAREGLQVLQPLEISLYRYGGEEFAVVFPAEHIDNAARCWKHGG